MPIRLLYASESIIMVHSEYRSAVEKIMGVEAERHNLERVLTLVLDRLRHFDEKQEHAMKYAKLGDAVGVLEALRAAGIQC